MSTSVRTDRCGTFGVEPVTPASRGLRITTEIKTEEFVYVPQGRRFPSVGHSNKAFLSPVAQSFLFFS